MGISKNPYEAPASDSEKPPGKQRKPLGVRLLCVVVALYAALQGGLMLVVLVYFQFIDPMIDDFLSGDPVLVQSGISSMELGPLKLTGPWQIFSFGFASLLFAAWLIAWGFKAKQSGV